MFYQFYDDIHSFFYFIALLLQSQNNRNSQNFETFLNSVIGHSLMDHQNTLLNPVFDGLSFGITFNADIIGRLGCTRLEKDF
jgi:hypothetical protein